MINSKKGYLKNERETWLRTLDYIQQENVFLKNHLADIIKNDIKPEMLEQVEYFQNQFINKDAVIALLRYDIANQNKLSENGTEHNGDFVKLQAKQGKLRGDMEKMEREFSRLKFQFNTYIAETL
ncbi:MAG: hypothetical protein JSS96_03260 [Bacteroidetes bacterium]|nr:hypothetical protein [Bacteroidota bacterium]